MKRKAAVLSAAVLTVVVCAAGSVRAATGVAPKSPLVVFDLAGTGSARTSAFTLPEQWNLRWAFDCSASTAGPGNFSVEVLQSGSPPKHDPRIPRLLRFATSGAGLEQYARGGYRAFLRIASECAWTVRGTRPPS